MKNSQRLLQHSLFFFCILFIFLSSTSESTSAVVDSLHMCAKILIPSLFPCMVLSSLLFHSSKISPIGTAAHKVFSALFRLPGSCISVVFLGMICGFPIGAQGACILYEKKCVTKEQAERMIALANNAGPAFVISVIGTSFWKCRTFGIFLYFLQILSSILISVFASHLFNCPSYPSEHMLPALSEENTSFSLVFAEAVSSSARAMLNLCGYIVFFSGLGEFIEYFLHFLHAETIMPAIYSLLEFTQGSVSAVEAGGNMGLFLCGFVIGWSGISVFAQCLTFTASQGLSLRFTIICKFVQGFLCGITSLFCGKFFCIDASVFCNAAPIPFVPEYIVFAEIGLLILFCFFPYPKKQRKRKISSPKS